MKCLICLLLVSLLAERAFSYTFLLPVEIEKSSGRTYVSYAGRKHYLSDDPGRSQSVFPHGNCIVHLGLEKSGSTPYRSGSAICKPQFAGLGDQAWEEYAKERLREYPTLRRHRDDDDDDDDD